MAKKKNMIKNISRITEPALKLLGGLIDYREYASVYGLRQVCRFLGVYTVIRIELTNRCNLKCSICPQKNIEDADKGDIDFELFKEIVDEIARFVDERTIIRLYGVGEPLMYPRLFEAIEYLKTRCQQSPIQIATNATLLDEERSKMLIKSLDRKDWLLLSINAGSKSTYRWLAGSDRYDQVVNNIKNFLSIRKKIGGGLKPGVDIQILKTERTKPEISGFHEFWKPLIGPNDSTSAWSVINWGGIIDDEFSGGDTCDRYPCLRLWSTICITKDGNAYPCGAGLASNKKNEIFLGNIHEKSLVGIYSEKNKLREIHLKGGWEDIPICSKCDMWTHCPNIWIKSNGKFKFYPLDKLQGTLMYP